MKLSLAPFLWAASRKQSFDDSLESPLEHSLQESRKSVEKGNLTSSFRDWSTSLTSFAIQSDFKILFRASVVHPHPPRARGGQGMLWSSFTFQNGKDPRSWINALWCTVMYCRGCGLLVSSNCFLASWSEAWATGPYDQGWSIDSVWSHAGCHPVRSSRQQVRHRSKPQAEQLLYRSTIDVLQLSLQRQMIRTLSNVNVG